ncbi:MAG: hypothetical protein ABFC89_07195 [Methanospirillum sp.]
MNPGTTVADYLDAVRYRRYSRSVLLERRRLLGHALVCGGDAWLAATPADEIVATVQARLGIDSEVTLQRIRSAAEDYQEWRRRRIEQEAA